MKQARFLIVVGAMSLLSVGAFAQKIGELAIFTDMTGWIGQALAQQQADKIIADQKVFAKAARYSDKALGDWAKAKTGDGKLDVILLFGDYAENLYAPGNGQADNSVGEKFLEDGNMFLNTADYIFYVHAGAGANGDTGLKNMSDSTFDLWTDGNTNKPTADGKKYTPSLPASYSAPRSFKKEQITADGNWEIEVVLGDNGGGDSARMDPVVIKHKKYGGRIGIALQVPDDAQPRDKVLIEFINNWMKSIAIAQAVDPRGKAAISWGELKKSTF